MKVRPTGQLGMHSRPLRVGGTSFVFLRLCRPVGAKSVVIGKENIMVIESVNPATGRPIKVYEEMGAGEVDRIIAAVHDAFRHWRRTPFTERATLVRRAAFGLRKNVNEYARLMAIEMGKPMRDGRAEVEKCASGCEYYADNAERFLEPEVVQTNARKSFVAYQPLGVILAVMPWNFPFWQVFRFAAAALMAGNGVVLKHASNVSGCSLAIEDLFRQAGFPENLFRVVLLGGAHVEAVIKHPKVRAVTVTGSTAAGKAVARKAGEMLKKTVLELGGSDPYVILDDADLPRAVELCVRSRLINSGQSCIAAKRFIVVASRRREFEELFVSRMQAAKVGDPLDEQTEVGPQARWDLRQDLHRQVRESVAQGAVLLLGGEIPPGEGAFYPPTVLTDAKRGMPAHDEELFGPVAAIVAVEDEADAIQAANDSSFGLGAAVFTRDLARGERIAAEEIEAGSCFVNDFVRSDPRLPFGGIKESGYGRELSSHGIREFVNIKTVVVG
jgi:succinate-semialdehyde dehydrogenase/glutarate-semialdehyde dehydrogenase